ncbi:MAG TPA: nucleoside hydrolase [Gemmatimonadales bacterium]|nr:nucleoside hydrolase [Gemmatimonadales bacterium]
MPEETRPSSPVPLPVIIDTDPGIDDCLALLLALNSPELDVRGISISYGNTVVENAYRNAVEILRKVKHPVRVPLGIGARRPLKRQLQVADDTHGPSGLGYADVPPAGVILDYVRPLERMLDAQPEPVTLVTLGPITSLALVLRANPGLVRDKVSRHVAMIGNVEAAGNQTRFSEFNAWCDPEALATVLAAEIPTEMIGLDVTRKVIMKGSEVERLAQHAPWLYDALRFYVEFHKKQEGLDGAVINDVLAIAYLIQPDVLTFSDLRISVSLDDGQSRGRTKLDAKGSFTRVAMEVHPTPVRRLLFERALPTGGGALVEEAMA